MEHWDAYDEEGRLLDGVTLIRGEQIPQGTYHLVCDVIVRHTDGTYLLMQRDENKHYGGMWEATAGGSALQGETAEECAKRELWEETGIRATVLQELGRTSNPSRQAIYAEFLCVTDQDKHSVVLQQGETQDYKWVDKQTLQQMKEQELVTKRMQRFLKEW